MRVSNLVCLDFVLLLYLCFEDMNIPKEWMAVKISLNWFDKICSLVLYSAQLIKFFFCPRIPLWIEGRMITRIHWTVDG